MREKRESLAEALMVSVLLLVLFTICLTYVWAFIQPEVVKIEDYQDDDFIIVEFEKPDVILQEEQKMETVVDIEDEIYWDSLEYVAMCVQAEAGNQGELGKRYVADCILNRFDKGNYEDYYEVINKPGQFSCVKNGAINCIPTEETYKIVSEELENRTNSEILYFRKDDFHNFGVACFSYADHYFSK